MRKARVLEGLVVSDKMDRTITVQVNRKFSHHLYKKATLSRKKYKAHDKNNEAKPGDRVKIIECRPYSKDKNFRLVEIIK